MSLKVATPLDLLTEKSQRIRLPRGQRNPCASCGGQKPTGSGRRLCDDCRPVAKGCIICGGTKPPGKGRRVCDGCSSPSLRLLRAKPGKTNRARHLWLRYKLTLEDYDRMLAEQSGVCAICSGDPVPYAHFDVDHDAKTGRVRGLLCRRCNTTLGLIENGFILPALAYLERHGSH